MLEENLENAITFEKSESGYHQNPIDRDLGWTDSQVEKFKVKECEAVLTSLGFHAMACCWKSKQNSSY